MLSLEYCKVNAILSGNIFTVAELSFDFSLKENSSNYHITSGSEYSLDRDRIVK